MILTKQKSLTTYAALLRGINVGGNAIIKMADLRGLFEKIGFADVVTYIQSGNVIFKATYTDSRMLEKKIETALAKTYTFKPKVVIRTFSEMEKIVAHIPKDWHSATDKKCNVIFLRASIDSPDILKGLNPKDSIESITYAAGVLYWSAHTSDLSQSSMVKLSSQPIYQEMTVRNLNTTKKMYEIMREIAK